MKRYMPDSGRLALELFCDGKPWHKVGEVRMAADGAPLLCYLPAGRGAGLRPWDLALIRNWCGEPMPVPTSSGYTGPVALDLALLDETADLPRLRCRLCRVALRPDANDLKVMATNSSGKPQRVGLHRA